MGAYIWFKAKKSQLKLSSYINFSSFLQRQLTSQSSPVEEALLLLHQVSHRSPGLKFILKLVNYFALKNYFLKIFSFFNLFLFFSNLFWILCQPGIKSHSSDVMLSTGFLPQPSGPYMLLLFSSFAGKCTFIQAHSFLVFLLLLAFLGRWRVGVDYVDW